MNLKFLNTKNQRGIAMIEYALLIALVAVAVYAAIDWSSLKLAIEGVITDITSKL